MKICCPCFIRLPDKSAHSVHVVEMCEALALKRADVVLLTPFLNQAPNSILQMYGVKQPFTIQTLKVGIPYKGKYLFSLPLILYARKSIRPTVLYTRFLSLAFWSVIARMPTLLELHIPLYGKIERQRLRFIVKSKYFIGLIVISNYLKKYYSSFTNKILLCPDGVAMNKFPSVSVDYVPNVAGYVGQLYKGRGIELILALARKFTNIEFHIWGGNERNVRFWQETTRNLPNVKFNGFVPHRKIYQILQSCRILLLPYERQVYVGDGKTDTAQWMSPLKLFEYMGSGRPIIASDLQSLREILVNKHNALLVSPDNIKEWENALQVLLEDDVVSKYIAENARSEALEKYSWEKRAEKIFTFIGSSGLVDAR